MESKQRKIIIYWLLTGCLLIFLMVIVGGITRLTGSGLSITEWKVITGTFPPLNETQWQHEFYKYRQSPQYRIINSDFTLSDFKGIYWWEYIHRLTGRIIGFVFLIPFIFFLVKKWIDKNLLPKLITIFCLGGLQGMVGWLMVYTGLQSKPYVSHFALASHLIVAFITFAYIWWVALDLIFGVAKSGAGDIPRQSPKPFTQSILLLIILFIQIIYGAFVAGLKAGHVYNTFPKMGDEWVAESVTFAFMKDGISSLVYNLATVQFIHRITAMVLVVFVFYMWLKRKNAKWNLNSSQINALNIGMVAILIQFLLGVFALIYNVPITLGILHQAGGFVLLGALVYLLHRLQPAH